MNSRHAQYKYIILITIILVLNIISCNYKQLFAKPIKNNNKEIVINNKQNNKALNSYWVIDRCIDGYAVLINNSIEDKYVFPPRFFSNICEEKAIFDIQTEPKWIVNKSNKILVNSQLVRSIVVAKGIKTSVLKVGKERINFPTRLISSKLIGGGKLTIILTRLKSDTKSNYLAESNRKSSSQIINLFEQEFDENDSENLVFAKLDVLNAIYDLLEKELKPKELLISKQ